MKIRLLLVIILSYALMGCDNGVYVYTDEDTGCQYVTLSGYGMYPRMGADGKQICKDYPN